MWQAEYLNPNAFDNPDGLAAGDTVALKILNPEHLETVDQFEQRWRRIADFYVGRDWHPSLVRIYQPPFRGKLPHHPGDYFETGAETLYLPMEYLEGRSLRGHVLPRGSGRASAPLSLRRNYVQALEGVAAGLAELASVQATHQSGSALSKRAGLVHRDVKPDNIIFPPGRSPVLVDFGSMREMFTSRMYSGISGTAGYMAPEVTDHSVDWALRATPAVDLYGFACVVYFTLSGQDPPVQQSRWTHHLDTFLDMPSIPALTRELLEQVLLEDDPATRLEIDIADWSRKVTESLSLPSTLRPIRQLIQPSRNSIVASAGDVVTPTDTTETETENTPPPEHSPRPKDSRSSSAAPSPITRPGKKPERRSTKKRGGLKDPPKKVVKAENSELVSRRPYVYLPEKGKISKMPNKAGGIGIIDSPKGSYEFIVLSSQVNDAEYTAGKNVWFRVPNPTENIANPVSSIDRLFPNLKPAPYNEVFTFWPGFLGASISTVIYSILARDWFFDSSLSLLFKILFGATAFVLLVLTGFFALGGFDFRMPNGDLRTWWEERHVAGKAKITVLLTISAFGAALTTYSRVFLESRAGVSIIDFSVAFLLLLITFMILAPLILNLLWVRFALKTPTARRSDIDDELLGGIFIKAISIGILMAILVALTLLVW